VKNDQNSASSRRVQRLEEAWGLGVQGYYDAALEIIDTLLQENPQDTGSLRLKGNLLELKEMDLMEYSGRKLISSADFVAARACYSRILEIEPGNVKAHIDLGDHYRNLGANDKALEYYREAVNLLQQMPQDETWKEDVEELGKAVALLKKHDRLAMDAGSLESWCVEALRNRR